MSAPERNEKRGQIHGGLVSNEALDSASNFVTKSHYGGHKGAQQFFTPKPAAALVGRMLNSGSTTVLDLQAGDGSLIQAWPDGRRFGIELDPDQPKNADEAGRGYHRIVGDVQQVFPLLLKTLPPLTAIAVNPPFGLRWSDPAFREGREVNSALLTLHYVKKLLANTGQFAFLCGRDRFWREIADQPEAKGIYAAIEVPDLFEGTDLPAVICFGAGTAPTGDVERTELRLEQLEEHGFPWADGVRRRRAVIAARSDFVHLQMLDAWPALAREYKRRHAAKHSLREFDVALVGGAILDVQLSAFAKLAVARRHLLPQVEFLNRQSVHYFVQNEGSWKTLLELAEDDTIRIDPRIPPIVEAGLHEARRVVAPLYPLKPQQRLGFLTEQNTITCIKSDEESGFVAGEKYGLLTDSFPLETQETKVEQVRAGKNAGEWVERHYRKIRKVLRIRITSEPGGSGQVLRSMMDDESQGKSDILYLIDHFEIPDPGDIATRYPEDYGRMLALLDEMEESVIVPTTRENGDERRFRKFQKEDLARLLVKESGLLAWEQGLGKTLGGGAFAQACINRGTAKDQVLIVAPQDLIPQWIRELEFYFGRKVELIKTHAEAHALARKLKRGGTGWYITYFEALATSGTRQTKLLPDQVISTKVVESLVEGHWAYDEESYERRWVPEQLVSESVELWSNEFCPSCHADSRSGWNGVVCENVLDPSIDNRLLKPRPCGYVHYEKRVKSMGALLSTAFRKGVVVVDEQTMMKGDEAQRAKVVRGLMGRHKLGMTGTPVKNFIPDAFWLLWWTLSHNPKRFPYTYVGGKTKFENDFAVIQYRMEKHRKGPRTVLADVTNLSMLWKLLCASIIRRRKEETGEPIVDRRFHTVEVPLGVEQKAFANTWLKKFPAFFTQKNPDHALVRAGLVDIWAPMIGLQQKLDYAATMPENDPDWPWTQHTVSNWTPANLRLLELTMALVRQDRKVLIGSNNKTLPKWIAEQLHEKGVRAIHLLNGREDTVDPKKRAERVYAFQTDGTQVLCAGIKALRLGHNLDAASAVIVHGLEWDYESFSQFIARVHRLTSKASVDVYILVPSGTLTAKKWERLQQKGDAADLALDGRITEYQEETVDEAQIVREMIERGIPATGDELDEIEVERAWSAMPNVYSFEPDVSLLGETGEHTFKKMSPATVAPAVVTVPADPDVPATVEVEVPGGRTVEILLPEIPDDFFDDEGQASLFDDDLASFIEIGE